MPFWTLRRKLAAAVVLAIALAFGWAAVVVSVALAAARDQATTADAIAVLGAAQYNGRPSPVFRARLDHAAALYQRGLGANRKSGGATCSRRGCRRAPWWRCPRAPAPPPRSTG